MTVGERKRCRWYRAYQGTGEPSLSVRVSQLLRVRRIEGDEWRFVEHSVLVPCPDYLAGGVLDYLAGAEHRLAATMPSAVVAVRVTLGP